MPTKKPWFKKAILERKPDTLEGWRKEMPAEKRRADAIASRPVNWTNKKKYLSAARALQALSNVTRDAETKRLAKEDADYFFEKAKGKKKMEGGGSVRTRRNIQRYNYLNIEKQKAGLNIMIRHEGVDQVNEWREQHPEWNDDVIMSELFDDVQGNSEYLFVPDGGEAGFGLTNAPMILDGYHYVGEKGNMYDTDYPKSAHVYYFGNYMIISPLEVLLRDKSVFFTEAKAAGGYMEKGGETQTLKVESEKDLEEVAMYMTKAVKKHRSDLKDLVYYFEKDNNFDYRVRVKVWNDMNMYEAPKTYENILKLLQEIVKGNGKSLYSDNKKEHGGKVHSFIDDDEKMRDFKEMSKEDFLKSYSYLTEAEYDATAKELEEVVDQKMLDQMVKGYMDAVLFTEMDDDEEPLDKNYSNEDFDPETVVKIRKMISQYIEENLDAIKASGIDYDTIGNDIWYAQSGAGAGFFDHNIEKEISDKLRKAAKKFVDLSAHVFAQDGKVYIEGGWFSEKFQEGGEVKSFINKFLDLSVLNEKVPLNEIFTKKIE